MEEAIVPLINIEKLKYFKTKEHVFEDKIYLSIFVKAHDIYHLELLEIIALIITCCNSKEIKYGMSWAMKSRTKIDHVDFYFNKDEIESRIKKQDEELKI